MMDLQVLAWQGDVTHASQYFNWRGKPATARTRKSASAKGIIPLTHNGGNPEMLEKWRAHQRLPRFDVRVSAGEAESYA